MEKRTPHNKLSIVRGLIATGKVRSTFTALGDAAAVGVFGKDEMCAIISNLENKDFYKSMTTNNDHRVWQDVWHGKTLDGIPLYVKLTVDEGLLIVSFKELGQS